MQLVSGKVGNINVNRVPEFRKGDTPLFLIDSKGRDFLSCESYCSNTGVVNAGNIVREIQINKIVLLLLAVATGA